MRRAVIVCALLAAAGACYGQRPLEYGISQTEQVTRGLVYYWSMHNAGGVVFDETGTLNAAPVDGTTFAYASGVVGDGASFDGTNDRIDTSGNPTALNGVDTFTVSVWFRQNAAANAAIVGTSSANSGIGFRSGFQLRARSDGRVRFATIGYSGSTVLGTYTYDTTNALLVTGWNHVVVVYRCGALGTSSVWINGQTGGANVLVASSGTDQTSLSHDKPLEMGCTIFSGGRSEFHAGQIDEVRVYTVALTVDEIRQLYRMGRTILDNR